MMAARNHHYVPQWYLRRWGDEKERVVFTRDDKILPPTNPKNVLAKRDFYAAPTLTLEDIVSLCLFVLDTTSAARPAAEAILQEALFHSTMKTVLLQSRQLPKEEKQAIEGYLTEAEERRLAISEARAKHVVDRVIEGGVGVLSDPESAISLHTFLGDMYFRTLRARELGRQLKPSTDGGIAVLTRILSAGMTRSLLLDRSAMPPALLDNHTSRRFITSDNPVVNVLRPLEDRPPTDKEFALYLPLSPTHALVVPPLNHTFLPTTVTESLAATLNACVVGSARETLVARTREDLVVALKTQGTRPPPMRKWFDHRPSATNGD